MSHAATAGSKRSVWASLNDDASTTKTSGTGSSIAATSGTSTLPATPARTPDASSIAATHDVTVVLPSVPVTARTGRRSQLAGEVELAADGGTVVAGGGEDRMVVGHAGARVHHVGPSHQRVERPVARCLDQLDVELGRGGSRAPEWGGRRRR